MIIEMKPLSMAESKEIIGDREGKEEFVGFIKKFSKMNEKEALELKKELNSLEILKMKEENIVKIADLMPEDAADLNKIFIETSLDENEINKVLEVVKKYK